MSYGPYNNFLEVRLDGSIIVRGDSPTPCASCGRCHFSWRAALKCAWRLRDAGSVPVVTMIGGQ